jgi:2-hydroxychromene-2-carboxylate isomerase
MKQKLRSLYLTYLLDDRCIAARQFLLEFWRTLTFRKRVVSVFLQLDDPYSYLLCHYLGEVVGRYKKVEFRFYLCQALRGEYMPQPAMLTEYALNDCTLLAQEFGIPFLDVGSMPAVKHRRSLLEFLAAEHDEEDFGETIIKAITLYWRGDAEGISRLMGRSYGETTETNVLVGKNQLLLRKMGHYNCATMFYAGEWYWGVDRLHYLVERFDDQGLNRFREPIPELASLEQASHFNLPVTVSARAESLPPLEMFHSFRSPYSYIALQQAFDIADAFGLKLEVRPVLPMVMRGVGLPKSKMIYIVMDAKREADRREVPFGRIADSLGVGSERCMAAFYYATEQGRERDFLLEAGKAIFAEGIDVATDEGLQLVAERVGLFWPELQTALQDESWRDKAEANRALLTDVGLWGVPTFKIGQQVFWGQDRDWLLARKIEDLCHGGEGIMI